MNISAALRALLLAAFTLVSVATAAEANPKFAAVTVDARTGAILYDDQSNALRHPASLTKMMTLYILFQELKAGRVKLSTPLKVSRRAASMAPSKLGMKPGSTISVELAIKALIVKSANDVAATVGENLGGNEVAFAQRMTKVARAIGMSRTVYRNASGLPNPSQVTTARDQATLGLRLMRDFPQYYPYFRSTQFSYKGKLIRGHNRLVNNYAGTDGIKTGYVNASGFNLVTSTRRGEKRLVGVVLGGKTASRRNAFMMTMLERSFKMARNGRTIAATAGSSKGVIDPIQNLKAQKNASAPVEQETDNAALAAVAQSVADDQEPAVLESGLTEGNEEGSADEN
jgi:D-alanyl-D-alanine carboxypeptidase